MPEFEATPFMGIRGSQSFIQDARPKSWRQMLLRLDPSGSAALTALTSMMPNEPKDDYDFNWFTKILPLQGGDITDIFTDAALSTSYAGTTPAVSGDTLYIQAPQETVEHFTNNYDIRIAKKQDIRVQVNAEVKEITKAGADSSIKIELLTDDVSGNSIANADFTFVIGNANEEHATMPEAIMYDEKKFYNLAQTFRTPLKMSRRAIKTRYRTGDKKQEAKFDTLRIHGKQMEFAYLLGQKSNETGPNGLPKTRTQGLFWFLKENLPSHIEQYNLSADFTGQTWLEGGYDFLDKITELLSRYMSGGEIMCLIGSKGFQAVTQIAREHGDISIEPTSTSFGLNIKTWIGNNMIVHFFTHPLFSQNPVLRRTGVFLNPSHVRNAVFTDTFYKKDSSDTQNTNNSRDGQEEEFLSDMGPEFWHPNTFYWASGFGLDNQLA